MFPKGWRQREQNARDRMAAQQAKRETPEYKIQREYFRAQERAQFEAAERERAEREAPLRAVTELLRERFGAELPAFARAVAAVGGLAKVAAFLDRTLSEHDRAERAAVDQMMEAASVEASKRSSERRAKEKAERDERRAAEAAAKAQEAA